MGEVCDIRLHRAVGMSDLAALLAEAFRFPKDDRLASALADGSFLDDWNASWVDARGGEVIDFAESRDLERSAADDRKAAFTQSKHDAMKREYSRLFLSPGSEVLIWPYESAFLHRAAGRTESPNLFLTRSTVDVERQMAAVGVRPEHLRTEPCDACATELEFLSFLYAKWGESLRCVEAAEEAAGVESEGYWRDRIVDFAKSHALRWMPRFFDSVSAMSRIPQYCHLAGLGAAFMVELEVDVARSKGCHQGCKQD